jgi:transcriptional regulator with XRE-family HTH domain
MDHREEVREFLVSRRARVKPEDVGIPAGTGRRVPGLRRSEVAFLASVSVEYYTKLERGALSGASPEVLNTLARALRLDEAERAHLFDLAQADGPQARRPRRRPKTWAPHTGLQWALDAVTAGPAFVRNGRLDLLAWNALARAFYKDVFDMPRQSPPNIARYMFLDERARDSHPDWETFADTTVSILRTEAGRDPRNKDLHDLVGELSTRSEEFRIRWGAHDVRHHGTGFKTFHHPVVGEVTVSYEGLEMAAEPGLTLTIYSAEPGSPSAERLQLLASWAASHRKELGLSDPAAPRHSPSRHE